MKRSIPTGYMGVLTALLPVFFACTAVRAAAEADTRRVRQTVHGDSLVLRAGGRLPVYECNGRIYLELPREGVEVTAQIDRGQGIRNRALPVDSTLSCFTEPDKMRTIHAGTSDRPLVDITDPLLSVDGWANPAGEVGTPDTGRNELLGVEPFGEGVLFRLRNRYKYTNGETMVTMALPSGVQPMEFSVALTLRGKVRPRILIAGSTLPETYARLLNLAVKRYNRAHRKNRVRLAQGKEVVDARHPYAASYDLCDKLLRTEISGSENGGKASFARIGFGACDDAQDVLRHALRTATSASGLWELLSDEIGCREAYLGERLDRTLQEIFDGVRQPDPAAGSGVQITTAMQEADRQMALWAEFVQQGATKERREKLARTSPLIYSLAEEYYAEILDRAVGVSGKREVLQWIAANLTADAAGRFDTGYPQRTQVATAESHVRKVWRRLFETAPPAAFTAVTETFAGMTEAHSASEAAFAVQDACVHALNGIIGERPEFAEFAAALADFYVRETESPDLRRKTFAKLQIQRLNEIRNR